MTADENAADNLANKLAGLRAVASRVNDAVMRDPGGFWIETLHALSALCDAFDLPDYVGVISATDWTISGDGEENVRFFGASAHTNPEDQ